MGVRFNLAWTYGDIFQDLPQRLGRNKALDASIAALTSAHTDFCTNRQELSPQTLQAHGLALSNVRICLSDPEVAAMPETLCAVYLLLICQVSLPIPVSSPSNRHSHLLEQKTAIVLAT